MTSMQPKFNAQLGFLPDKSPLTTLPETFSSWEQAAHALPKLLLSDQLQVLLKDLPDFPVAKLVTKPALERAMLLLSFIGHAYVWGGSKPASILPASLAVPWYEVAQRLGRPPVLSYASYALHNWKRLQPERPVELGNIALLQNFWGGIDEEWFILIHVDIEAKAIPAIASLIPAQSAVADNQPQRLLDALQTIGNALEAMVRSLKRMPEHCDPFIYYNRVRPFIHGWNNNPSLPDGLLYEGVSAYQNKPQCFRGETGAQSSIIPALDTLLEIEHADDPLKAYLLEMRNYMPPEHRDFLNGLAKGPSVRAFVIREASRTPELAAAYNACVRLIERFRAIHLQYAASYIHQQAQTGQANPTEIGTGGTPFMRYLDKHKQETERFLIDP